MKLSKPTKILVGVGTAWLTVYPVLFFAVWLTLFLSMGFLSQNPQDAQPPFMKIFFAIFPLHFLTILLQFVLMAFYLIHIIKNTTASETIRIILGIGTFFVPFVAMPVYYYLFIWHDQPPRWAVVLDTSQSR
jgi:hypothetical protein